MKSMDTVKSTLKFSLKECDFHLEKMNLAYKSLEDVRPFHEDNFPPVDEFISAHLDQFLFRFIKMQDSIAKRLLPSLYQILEDSQEPKPILDILNLLEKLGILESVDTWQYFRELRNNLVHDYPESRAQNIINLNVFFKNGRTLHLYIQVLKLSSSAAQTRQPEV